MNTLDKIAFVDVETTGMRNSRVIEIGIVRVESGKVVEKFESLIDPETYIPTFITNITGIDSSMLENAPTFYSIIEKIENLLEGAVFTAHCVGFDYGMLSSEFKRVGFGFEYPRLCTRNLSRALFPRQEKHSLATLIDVHGLKVNARHRALADADALWQFWQKNITPEHTPLLQDMIR